METKRIRCPRCRGILEVTNPKGEDVLMVTCPNPQCGAHLRIDFRTGDTVLAKAGKGDDIIGCIAYAGDCYPLCEGINTIGRKAGTSDATLQIETDDRSMSRKHAQIRVVRLKSGRVKAILSDVRDAQKAELLPIIFDDAPLFPGDAVVLADGDDFTLGRTKLKYKKQNTTLQT